MFPATTQILIAEDSVPLRTLLKTYLRNLGFRNVTEAEDGKQANRLLMANKGSGSQFQLVISDWNMPGMDGLELLKNVRNDIVLEPLPFILMTTESERAKVLQAVLANVTAYIVKPVDEKLLEAKLTQVWELMRKRSSAGA